MTSYDEIMSAGSRLPRTVTSSLSYGKQLVESGFEGAGSGVRDVLRDEPVNTALSRAARSSWKAAAIGAGVGLAVTLWRRRRSGDTLLGGLAGCALGFSAGMLWASRDVTGAAVKGAVTQVNAARDAHWLNKHPIDYA